ncbi:Rmf/CrpP family protein [Teredinibacter turnerae]|uniref:ribosome modulation factor n=1 Tax=Teredinibacter turnerae TaxID=2426 RepID=UPI00036D08D3|nr:Rmf/CrpP family protein [Teredinibacter turnerae]
MSPYDEGYEAVREGKPINSNPYHETESSHSDWIRGWEDATEDFIDKLNASKSDVDRNNDSIVMNALLKNTAKEK